MYASTYPHIIAYCDGISILQSLVAPLKVDGMSCRVETAVRSNEHIITKPNLCCIEDDEVVVGIEVFAYLNVIAIVSPERGGNRERLFRASKQSAN